MYTFALIYTDTDLRCELLGINKELYGDKTRAEMWYEDIVSEITGVRIPAFREFTRISFEQTQAISILDNLYKRMIKNDEGDI